MLSLNNMALKEWAAVCSALAQGTQQILFRKGGIHEGAQGFRPEFEEFWLFPTGFHQTFEGVRPEFLPNTLDALNRAPHPGQIQLQQYCRIHAVHWVDDEAKIEELRSYHILTDEAVAKRFHYRRPGLFVMVLETHQLKEPISIVASEEYDGCHSWVTLEESLPTRSLQRCGDLAAQDIAEQIETLLSLKVT